MIIKIVTFILLYLICGALTVFIEKAYDVVSHDDSKYWEADGSEELAFILWPCIAVMGFIFLIVFLIKKMLKWPYVLGISVVETIRVLKIKRKKANQIQIDDKPALDISDKAKYMMTPNTIRCEYYYHENDDGTVTIEGRNYAYSIGDDKKQNSDSFKKLTY